MHGDVREGEPTPFDVLLRSARCVMLDIDIEAARASAEQVRAHGHDDDAVRSLAEVLLVELYEPTREARAHELAARWQAEERARLGLEPLELN